MGFLDAELLEKDRKTRWLTPRPIVEALGTFDLDPCGAPGHELAAVTYQIDDGQDGLTMPWSGRVWCNPPYGREAVPFMRRMAEHGNGTALIFARTETAMFFDHVWDTASAVLFLRGRVKFGHENGDMARFPASAPSCLVAYGDFDADTLRDADLSGKFIDLRISEPKDGTP